MDTEPKEIKPTHDTSTGPSADAAPSEDAPRAMSVDITPLEDLQEATRGVVETVRHASSRMLRASLASYGLSALIGVYAAFSAPVRDPYFFVAMYIVLFVYVLSYIKAQQLRARLRSTLTLLVSELLIAFWIFILVDRIPARQVFLSSGDAVATGEVITREPMTILWGSIILLGMTALSLAAHWVWSRSGAHSNRLTDTE